MTFTLQYRHFRSTYLNQVYLLIEDGVKVVGYLVQDLIESGFQGA